MKRKTEKEVQIIYMGPAWQSNPTLVKIFFEELGLLPKTKL